MTNQKENTESKKNWVAPQVTTYGNINTITQQNKTFIKNNGNGDDLFQIASDFN